MPEALAFIREWVRRAGGDELEQQLEALRVSIKATRGEAEIRVEAPVLAGSITGSGVPGRQDPARSAGCEGTVAADREAAEGAAGVTAKGGVSRG